MAWIQFICNTTSDKADALSDAFSECGAVAVTFEDDADQPIYEPDLGTTPLWTATRIVALFDAETNPDDVDNMLSTLITDPPSYRVEAVEDKDWEREWMDNFHPIQFGERLWICPSWHTPPAPDAVNIMLDPGLAFGTGTHPTTALCLNWLDQAELKGKYVIDYGCGSGILAIAAALLGAERVIGVDTDPQALEATRANAARNGVEIEAYLPGDCPNEPCDLLLANILAGPLQTLAPLFANLAKPNTELVLSGILQVQAEEVSESYQAWFDMQPAVVKEDWIRLNGTRHAR
ncbi:MULTISPECIES: 50S ribosomal protein L11 methyltransferase [unclassified Methylophaga]|jgi:ribosomal protein L11 methyltransferase|uniref:50S ribosomal protein L11 methyltransferase n=1 Tax=unclassified Methylophaga TaxID=2629249 RepID=UPI00259CF731|nr:MULTISPECIES: 50S ribosomal protein L11 methyltransferase [unclassified Methylophaga]|tara:strand:+ start:9426 stop:10298 length:873 start_codon:yes stop_codon:yes gene_type:complete